MAQGPWYEGPPPLGRLVFLRSRAGRYYVGEARRADDGRVWFEPTSAAVGCLTAQEIMDAHWMNIPPLPSREA